MKATVTPAGKHARRLGAVTGLAVLVWLLWSFRDEQRPAARGDPVAKVTPALGTGVPEQRPPELHPRPPAPTAETGVSVDAGEQDAGRAPDDAERLAAFLRMNAARADEQIDSFCAESSRLRALRALRPATQLHDAAVYLSVRVDWDNGKIGLLHLPQPLLERMRTPERNWRTFTAADYEGLDFSWFKDLAAFDHWSLGADGPLRDEQAIDFYSAAQPDFRLLQQWAKLRLIKARNEGDLAQASVEVRHLADLCASTETMNGEFQRTAMHGIERSVWELAGLQPSEPLPTPEDAAAYRALIVAGSYFLLPGVRDQVREKALACGPSRCVMLAEAIGASAAMLDLAPGAAQHLAWAREQGGCDASWLKRVVGKTKPTIVNEILENPTAGVGPSMSLLHDEPRLAE